MKIKCPRCKSKLEVEAVGDFVSCPSCSIEFNVEELHKTKSLIQKFHPFEESEPYIPPVIIDNKSIPKPSGDRTNEPNYVIVTDIRMNFLSMVEFMVKWAFASIPAFMIIGFVFIFFLLLFRGFTGK
jgi:hypothetical protein